MVQWVDRAQRPDGSWSKRFCNSVILNLSGEAGAAEGREEGGVDDSRLEEGEDGEEGSGEAHRQVQVSLLWGHCSFLLGPGAQSSFVAGRGG